MKNFLKSGELELVKGGYLVSQVTGEPVFNQEFVNLQTKAEYIVTFARLAKNKNFEGKQADTIENVQELVRLELVKKQTKFVETPSQPKRELTEKLKKEAMSFMTHIDSTNKVDKINNFLQQFELLREFEEFGVFFTDDVVKLNKIYTINEIVEAVSETIDLLN